VGSKVEPPVAKAESISDGDSASVITYSKRGKNTAAQQQLEEKSEKM